jgi:hypothetical protein
LCKVVEREARFRMRRLGEDWDTALAAAMPEGFVPTCTVPEHVELKFVGESTHVWDGKEWVSRAAL